MDNVSDKKIDYTIEVDYTIEIASPAEERRVPLLEKQKEALKIALDTRKFEIDLYWKRAIYFWAFIASIFTAFFAVLTAASFDHHNPIGISKHAALMYVSIVGLVFSAAWYCVNRGSKHWQENWEKIIERLEQNINGTVFDTKIINTTPSYYLLSSYPFSVSKVNQLMSLFIFLIWVGIFTFLFFRDELIKILEENPSENFLWIFLVSLSVIILILSARSLDVRLKKEIPAKIGILHCIYTVNGIILIVALLCGLNIFLTKITIYLSIFYLLISVFFGSCKSKNRHLDNRKSKEKERDELIYLPKINFGDKPADFFYPKPFKAPKE